MQKFREGIDLWLSYANLLLNVLYHIVMEMKIRESCLQTGTFIYKWGFLGYKWDSWVTIYQIPQKIVELYVKSVYNITISYV